MNYCNLKQLLTINVIHKSALFIGDLLLHYKVKNYRTQPII